MADVPGKFFSAKKVRTGVSPSSPGVIEGEVLPPVNPPGSSLAEYVTYTGATGNVDLGEYGIDAGFVNLDTTPTGTPTTQGTIFWDSDDETVDIVLNGYTMKIGEDLFYPVKNQTGSTIAKGVAVRFAGTLGASGRLLIEPFIANGTVPSSRFMGVTAEEILNGEDGKVLYFGRVRGINTDAFNEGDILYASTTVAGGYQTAIPLPPNNIVQVAAVISKSATVGTIFVRPTLGSNINTDEGVKITSVADKNLLQYQSGTGLWENKTLDQVLGGTSSQFVKGDGSLDSTTYVPTSRQVVAGAGLAGGGALTSNVTLSHADTSSQSSVNNSNGNVIQDITLDTYGHITALGSINLDSRYYTESEIDATLTNYQLLSAKGQPNGYAGLDSNGKVPLTQINDALIGNVNFQGLWNAATNTPTLANPPASGTKGYYYIVSTGGTFAGISFEVGDWIISDGSAWGKVDNTDAVSSVFGRTGNVTAANGDYNTSQVTENTNLYFTQGRAIASVLTGYVSGAGTISSADTIISAIQKLNGNIGTLTTTNIAEGTNLYFTNARARAALSFAAGSGAYNSTTGVITIPTNNNQITNGAGYITSAALGAYLPLAGGTMTGNINWGQTDRGLTWAFNTDGASIKFYNTGDGDTDSRLEFATLDNNNEYFRWTHIPSGGSAYESMRLVPNGNGSAQLIVSGSIIKSGGTSAQFLKADGSVDSNTYLTGNQTITLSGVVTGSGTTAITTAIANGAITNAMLANSSFFVGTTSIALGRASAAQTLNGVSISGNAGTVTNGVYTTGNQTIDGIKTFSERIIFNNTSAIDAIDLSNNNIVGVNKLIFDDPGPNEGIEWAGGNLWKIYESPNNLTTNGAGNLQIVENLTRRATFNTSGQLELPIATGTAPFVIASTTRVSNLNVATSGTADTWTTARTITIGNTGKSVNGSTNVSWSLAEIGAYAATNPSAFIALTSLSGVAPIQYNNTTGAISITQASNSTNGFLSSTDWTTFNNKQNALTNPVTGTGTTNYLPKFTGTSTIGNSQIFDNGTNVGIGTPTPDARLQVSSSNNTIASFTNSLIGSASINLSNNFNFDSTNFTSYSTQLIFRGDKQNRYTSAGAIIGPLASIAAVYSNTTFASDANQGAGALVFSTRAGTATTASDTLAERLRITSGGNVGIGTSSPSAILHTVANTNSNDTAAIIEGTGSLGSGLHLRASGTSGRTWRVISTGTSSTPGAGNLGFYDTTAGLYRMVINTSGNVLIGTTTNNGARLQVKMSNDGLLSFLEGGTSSVAVKSSGSLVMEANPLSNFIFRGFDVGAGVTEKMRITSTGNVLIGSPPAADNGAKLQVSGTATIGSGTQGINADADLTLREGVAFVGLDFKSARTSGNIGGLRFYNTSSDSVPIAQQLTETNGNFVFRNGTSGSETRLIITSSGNVLIGTGTDNGNKLRVNGNSWFDGEVAVNAITCTSGNTNTYINPIGTLGIIYSGQGTSAVHQFLVNSGERFAVTNSGIRTIAPSVGNAANWKLGDAITITTSATRSIRVEIAGTMYYLLAYT